MSADPAPAEGAPARSLRPYSAALVSLGVGLALGGVEHLAFVIAVPAVLLLSSLGVAQRPDLAPLARDLRPALLAVLVGSLRWEQSLLLEDELRYVDPIQIGGWALAHLPQGEAAVGGLLLAAALGLSRLDGAAAWRSLALLLPAAVVALGAEALSETAAGLLHGAHHNRAEGLFLLLGPAPAALLGIALAADALRRGHRGPALGALGLGACLALSSAVPAPRLHLMLAGVALPGPDAPVGPQGPTAQGAALELGAMREVDVVEVMKAHRRTPADLPAGPLEAEAGVCRQTTKGWARMPRAAEVLSAPAGADAAALLQAMAPLRAWSVDRVALLGRAEAPTTALSWASGAGPLWSRPTARLLLDRAPQGAALLHLGPKGLDPAVESLSGAPGPCALHVEAGASVQQLWSAGRALTEGPTAPCTGLSLSSRALQDADLCPPEG
jgi:hypothetical protein